MKIKNMMTKDPVTVQPDTLVLDAEKIMKEKNIRRLPVVEKKKLVGIVTQYDLLEASPSPATSLSIYELNYLLAKMKVREVMTKNPVTVAPETPFEEALRIGQEKKIGSFPVVEDGKLVGITTESDIVRFVIQALGIGVGGSKVTIVVSKDKVEELERIISIVKYHRSGILSMFSFLRPATNDRMMILRLKVSDPYPIIQDLKKAGFTAA